MSDAAPMSRAEWAAEFRDAKGDLIPAPTSRRAQRVEGMVA